MELFDLQSLKENVGITPQEYANKYISKHWEVKVNTVDELSDKLAEIYEGDVQDYPIEDYDEVNENIKEAGMEYSDYVVVSDGKEKRLFEID